MDKKETRSTSAWSLIFKIYGFYGVICYGVEGGGSGVSGFAMVDEFYFL